MSDSYSFETANKQYTPRWRKENKMTETRKSIYKEWFEVSSDEEETEKWTALREKGYSDSEIYIVGFPEFPREMIVFA